MVDQLTKADQSDWLAYLSPSVSLIGQLNQLIDHTKLLRTVDELKFSALGKIQYR
jgi:hypothetical protein